MTFQDFFLESFKDLPDETLGQIHQLSRQLSQITTPPKTKISMGSISVVNRETKRRKKIPIILSPKPTAVIGEWTGSHILIYWEGICRLKFAQIENFIVHEVIHAVQHYKNTSPTYDQAVTTIKSGGLVPRSVYFLEPAEFEAHLGTLRFHLINNLKRIKKSTLEIQHSEDQWYKQKTKYLNELEQFVRTPLRKSIKTLPKWIVDDKNFLIACLESPKHLKVLKNRLFRVWQELNNL